MPFPKAPIPTSAALSVLGSPRRGSANLLFVAKAQRPGSHMPFVDESRRSGCLLFARL